MQKIPFRGFRGKWNTTFQHILYLLLIRYAESARHPVVFYNTKSATRKKNVFVLIKKRGLQFDVELIAESSTIFPRSGFGIVESNQNSLFYLVEVKQIKPFH